MRHSFLLALSIFYYSTLRGCRQEVDAAVPRVKVGVIATLSGMGKLWSEMIVACAQLIADYNFAAKRQLSIPVVLSEYTNGRTNLARLAQLPD